jgi:hypothetical protein
MTTGLHGFHFGFDECLELVSLLETDTVKAGRADYFLFEALEQIGALLASDENIDQSNIGKTEENLLEEHLTQKTCCAGHQHPL